MCVSVCTRMWACAAWAFCISTPTASVHHNQLGGEVWRGGGAPTAARTVRIQPGGCGRALLEQKGESSLLFRPWTQRDESGRPPGCRRLSVVAAERCFGTGSSSGSTSRDPSFSRCYLLCGRLKASPPRSIFQCSIHPVQARARPESVTGLFFRPQSCNGLRCGRRTGRLRLGTSVLRFLM